VTEGEEMKVLIKSIFIAPLLLIIIPAQLLFPFLGFLSLVITLPIDIIGWTHGEEFMCFKMAWWMAFLPYGLLKWLWTGKEIEDNF
jgi:hypothetical protein